MVIGQVDCDLVHDFRFLGVVKDLYLLGWDFDGFIAEGGQLEGLFRDVVLDGCE